MATVALSPPAYPLSSPPLPLQDPAREEPPSFKPSPHPRTDAAATQGQGDHQSGGCLSEMAARKRKQNAMSCDGEMQVDIWLRVLG